MTKYRFAILKNETPDDHQDWVKACENRSDEVDIDIIDLTAQDWLENVTQKKYDFLLTRPPGRISYYKLLYDERVYIIHKTLNLPIYPTLNEILLYENKRLLSYFLKAKNIPHPETWVFYNREEALAFAESSNLPVVAKTNIGAVEAS